jgi:hypothetical protein
MLANLNLLSIGYYLFIYSAMNLANLTKIIFPNPNKPNPTKPNLTPLT